MQMRGAPLTKRCHAMLLLCILGLAVVVSFGSYVACMIFAARTGRLTWSDWLFGTLGLFCGFGWLRFLWRGNTVTLQHSVMLIDQGADVLPARELHARYRLAAGISIASTLLAIVLSRFAA
jgi:hypothetical protein